MCIPFQQMKVFLSQVSGLLNPLPLPKEPWEEVTADFIVELPESQGYNVILVAANRHTKHAHFVPSVLAVSTEGTACLFHDHVWKHHGWAQKIIMDQGTQFVAKFTCALNQLLSMEMALSMAYHPQTDGQTEQINQELEQYLRLYINHMQTDWADWLPVAEFTYNNCEHSATSHSPFYLKYSHHPFIPMAPWKVVINNPSAKDFTNSLSQARQHAYDALHDAAALMKRFVDQKWKEAPLYVIGQKVWLDAWNIQTEHLSKKLDVQWLGPFEVLVLVPKDAHSPSAYQLALPPSWKVHPVFHVSLLQPAMFNDDLHPLVIIDVWPPPDVIQGEEEYKVEGILDHWGGRWC
jgi:hypothetical protein